MTPETYASTGADDSIDVALHHEITCRAYELYERQHDAADRHALKDELRRVAYAAAQLQKHANGEVGDTRAVRAARVYLRALCSFVGDHEARGLSSGEGFTCQVRAQFFTPTAFSRESIETEGDLGQRFDLHECEEPER